MGGPHRPRGRRGLPRVAGFGLHLRNDHHGGRRLDGAVSEQDVLGLVCAGGVVPVIVAEDADLVRGLAAALKTGRLPVAEVTFRTPAALAALGLLAEDGDIVVGAGTVDRKSTRLNSSHLVISYAVFCLN